jgi:hypothetical protein
MKKTSLNYYSNKYRLAVLITNRRFLPVVFLFFEPSGTPAVYHLSSPLVYTGQQAG